MSSRLKRVRTVRIHQAPFQVEYVSDLLLRNNTLGEQTPQIMAAQIVLESQNTSVSRQPSTEGSKSSKQTRRRHKQLSTGMASDLNLATIESPMLVVGNPYLTTKSNNLRKRLDGKKG